MKLVNLNMYIVTTLLQLAFALQHKECSISAPLYRGRMVTLQGRR